MLVSIVKGDGTALGYFVFIPKVHVLCVMININSRVKLAAAVRQAFPTQHVSEDRDSVTELCAAESCN